jgi:hypothetical protein
MKQTTVFHGLDGGYGNIESCVRGRKAGMHSVDQLTHEFFCLGKPTRALISGKVSSSAMEG